MLKDLDNLVFQFLEKQIENVPITSKSNDFNINYEVDTIAVNYLVL